MMLFDEATPLMRLSEWVSGSASLRAFVIFSAIAVPYGVLALALLFTARHGGALRRWGRIAACAVLSRGIATEFIRMLWNRPRPFEVLPLTPLVSHEEGGAFPSGHAAFFFAIAFALWAVSRWWSAAMFSAALLNGFARVAAGLHWPTDILGGIVISFLSVRIIDRFLARRRRRTAP